MLRFQVRIPTDDELMELEKLTNGDNDKMHWLTMHSWAAGIEGVLFKVNRKIVGNFKPHTWDECHKRTRTDNIGFRPTFVPSRDDINVGEGDPVVIGTLYMNNTPVRVPQDPTSNGDITHYRPDAELELRSALGDPAYQVTAIRVGKVFVADRVLLNQISFEDIERATACSPMDASDLAVAVNNTFAKGKLKIRIPTNDEYDRLVEVTGGANSKMHWARLFSWVNDAKGEYSLGPQRRAVRGYHSAQHWSYFYDTTQDADIGFRPAVDFLSTDALTSGLEEGSTVVIGTLYMGGRPVRVPKTPEEYGDVTPYMTGTTLEMREALNDPTYQVTGIRVCNTVIADRVLVKLISYEDIERTTGSVAKDEDTEAATVNTAFIKEKKKMQIRIPTDEEYDRLVKVTGGDNTKMNWWSMFTWTNDEKRKYGLASSRGVVRGYYSARGCLSSAATYQGVDVGFRPTVDILGTDALASGLEDGATIVMGTLYMNGEPVRVPQNPVLHGDIAEYKPGASLEMQEPLNDPAYQVTGIRVGNTVIADRVLVNMISYEGIEKATGCDPRNADTDVAANVNAFVKEGEKMQIRIPTDEEYDRLVEVTGGKNAQMHWRDMFSWTNAKTGKYDLASGRRAVRGYSSVRHWGSDIATNQYVSVGFRPAVDILGTETLASDLKEGATTVMGTLYMNGEPVRVPQNPVLHGDVTRYKPGATLEMKKALDDPAYQVTGIRVGNAIIADRGLVNMISYEEIEKATGSAVKDEGTEAAAENDTISKEGEKMQIRIPTDVEYDRLVEVTGGDNAKMHWRDMFSWTNDEKRKYNLASDYRAARGYYSARYWDNSNATGQSVYVGFRPAVDILATDALTSDLKEGATTVMGTLYMNGEPVRVPQNPVLHGDVTQYKPGATLEMKKAMDEPAYQVTGIRVGNAVVADRVLVNMISYEGIEKAAGCTAKDVDVKAEPENGTISKAGEKMSANQDRTHTVTEWCPHCESEIEMRWNTDTMGFKAFCPVCGQRLMLCDECRHCETCGPCDYDGRTDTCRWNKAKHVEENQMEEEDEPESKSLEIPAVLGVDTPLGTIVVKTATDPEHPGVYIDLRRSGTDCDMPLAMVEFSADDTDRPEGQQNIITRVWGDASQEDYTDRVVHEGVEDYFRAEEQETEDDEYVVLSAPGIAVQMIADIKGKLSSRPFVIAQGRKHPENRVTIALIDNNTDLAPENRCFAVNMVNEVNPPDCEPYYTDSHSEESLVALLEEILNDLSKSGCAERREPGSH